MPAVECAFERSAEGLRSEWSSLHGQPGWRRARRTSCPYATSQLGRVEKIKERAGCHSSGGSVAGSRKEAVGRSGSGRLHADESEEESSEGARGSDCRWKGLTLTFVSASTRSRVPCVSESADLGRFASVESSMSPNSEGKHCPGALT